MDRNNFLIQLSESDKTDFGRVDFEAQSIPQKVFSAIWSLESEVNNGGFVQYFANYSAETAAFASEALKIIGANSTANIYHTVVSTVFPNGLTETTEDVQRAARAFDENKLAQLDELDAQFIARPDNLTDLLYDYVMENSTVFRLLK